MATRRYKHWTDEEIELLKDNVKKYYYNRQKAFRETSEVTGRPVASITVKWYTEVRHSCVLFTMLSKDGNTLNNLTRIVEDNDQ